MARSIYEPLLLGFLAILWISAAYVASPRTADLLFRASTLVVLSISWNLMANAGLISLAHAAFAGVGGYAAVLLAVLFGLPLLAVLPASIAGGAALGALLAAATSRLAGFYFAIATLAIAEGLRVLALMVPQVTGGAQGQYIPQELRHELPTLSVGAAVLVAACLALAYALSRSKFHYACRAMRNGESAAQMLGLNPRRYRLWVLVLSGAMTSCLGALTAWYAGFLDPRTAFSLHISIMAQIAPIIGGLYTVAGPVIGALALTGISEFTRLGAIGAGDGAGPLAYGVILVVCMLFMPQGIYGFIQRLGRPRAAPAGQSPGGARVDPPQARARGCAGETAMREQSASPATQPLLTLKDVSAGYGGSVAVDGISLEVRAGEVVCLLGANGAGKTTSLAAITGLIACSGKIEFEERNLLALAADARVGLGIALAPEGRRVFPNLSVHENLLLGSFNPHARGTRRQKLEEVYTLFPQLAERRQQHAGLMSGGEQQMLAIARALMSSPKLLLLDEPSQGLSPKMVMLVYEAIRKVAHSNVSILLVEQNAHAAFSVAQRGYLLSAGRIVHSDTVRELRNLAVVKEAFLGVKAQAGTTVASQPC